MLSFRSSAKATYPASLIHSYSSIRILFQYDTNYDYRITIINDDYDDDDKKDEK